ncbi:hypothetical protein GCM10027074_02770 [Streptomyces deserti]
MGDGGPGTEGGHEPRGRHRQQNRSFFYREGRPVRAEEADDLFRQGMLRVARATGEAERAWLREAISLLSQPS